MINSFKKSYYLFWLFFIVGAVAFLSLSAQQLSLSRSVLPFFAVRFLFLLVHVLIKNDFTLVNHAVDEDWGFPEPTPEDKWIR